MDLFRSPFMSVTIHGSSTRYNPRHDCDCSHHSRSHSPDLQNKTKYYGYREHTRLDQPFSTVFCFAADYHATLSFCNFLIFSPFLRSSLHRSNHSSFRSFSTSFPNRSITFISRPSFHYIHFASFPPIILSVFLNPFCLFIILNSLTIFMYSISLLVRLLLSALYEGFFPLASLLYHSYTILNSAHSPRSISYGPIQRYHEPSSWKSLILSVAFAVFPRNDWNGNAGKGTRKRGPERKPRGCF